MGNKNVITKDDCYLFGKGTHYEIYEKLGAHVTTIDGVKGTYFAVWAPHAVNVAVIGDFNDWLGFNHNMRMENDSGNFSYRRLKKAQCTSMLFLHKVGIHCTRLILMVFGLRKDPEMLQG